LEVVREWEREGRRCEREGRKEELGRRRKVKTEEGNMTEGEGQA